MKISDYSIIAFKGEAGAGKTTASTTLLKLLTARKREAVRMSFATPLKAACFEVFGTAFGVGYAAFYGSQADKNAPLKQVPGWSGRKILQHIGTEGFRHISPDVWPSYAIRAAKLAMDPERMAYDCVVFDDLRFLTEAKHLKQTGGLIIGLSGGHRVKTASNQGIAAHTSETEISKIEADITIDNTGDLDELRTKLQEIL